MREHISDLPEWLKEEEQYAAVKDQDSFLTKTILGLFSMISQFRVNRQTGRNRFNTCLELIVVIYMIVLMSLSRNMFFTITVLAYVIIRLIVIDSQRMMVIVRSAFTAMLLSMLVLLPAVFLGNPKSMLTISIKVFTSVSLLNLFTNSVPWNQLTECIRWFGIPDVFILTLDLTLKFILELGCIALGVSEAMKLRSVGKNRRKAHNFTGIMAILFLKTKEMSEEVYEAMVCRGFEGEYRKLSRFRITKLDIMLLMMMIAATVYFVMTEGWMR